jgi:hypothetical protein
MHALRYRLTVGDAKSKRPLVLGLELANARAAERDHRQGRGGGASLLASLSYTKEDWRTWLVPTEIDRELRTIIDGWKALSDADFAATRDALSMDDFYKLMSFAPRAVVFSLRDADPGWALGATTALAAIACARVDWRDLTTAAARTAYGLQRLGLGVLAALDPAMRVAEPQTRAILERFARQPPNSLENWGLEIVATARGPAFVKRDYGAHEPMAELLGRALGLASVLEADGFVATETELSTHLPGGWFSGPRFADAEKAGKSAKGCVIVHAQRRLASGPEAGQSLLAVVGQMASEADAKSLAAAVPDGGLEAALTVTDGAIFGVIVGRARSGATDPETAASLERFKIPFAAAIR